MDTSVGVPMAHILRRLCRRPSWKPRDGLASPNTAGVSPLEFLGDFAQYGMVVGRLIVCDGTPIHCAGRRMRLRETRDDVVVPALRVGIFLVHEGNAAKAVLKSCAKIGVGQISF